VIQSPEKFLLSCCIKQ